MGLKLIKDNGIVRKAWYGQYKEGDIPFEKSRPSGEKKERETRLITQADAAKRLGVNTTNLLSENILYHKSDRTTHQRTTTF